MQSVVHIPDKVRLRAEYIKQRQSLGPDLVIEHEKHIAAHALACVPEEALVVAGYAPVLGEADILPVLAMLAARGVVTALPCVEDKTCPLVFREWKVGEPLRQAEYGIREPELSAKMVEPGVLFVPMVAFDRRGHRLGYGGGCYDRTLADLRKRKILRRAIGIAYGCQEAPRLPNDVHDMPLDCIVTESGVVFNARN